MPYGQAQELWSFVRGLRSILARRISTYKLDKYAELGGSAPDQLGIGQVVKHVADFLWHIHSLV